MNEILDQRNDRRASVIVRPAKVADAVLQYAIFRITGGPDASGVYTGLRQVWTGSAFAGDPDDTDSYSLEFLGCSDELPECDEATYVLGVRVGNDASGNPVYRVFLGAPGKLCFVEAP